jgi:AcrR family transcriptional regulator
LSIGWAIIASNMSETKRKYRQDKRARSAEENRARIIEAARELLSRSGYHGASVDEIAEKSGVSRQTVYVQFGSKRGLLQALAEHIELESYGIGMVEGARESHDKVGMIRNGIADLVRFFAANSDLLRTFEAQAAHDPDFRAVWEDRRRERLVAFRVALEAIVEGGRLRAGWTFDEALDWLWSLTNFERYDELVVERGWTEERLVERLREAVGQVIS